MKISAKHLNRFNSENTVVVVSTYPRRGHTYDPKALAVAPFTKNKLNAISKQSNTNGEPVKFVILADTIEGEQAYVEDGHLIIRCWTRNLLSVYATIQKFINLFPKAKTLVIEHEFGIFGLKHQITVQFPFFLALNRLFGKKIVLVLHQVIYDLSQLAGHLQIDPKSKATKILSNLIQLNYRLFGLIANQIVVFDSSLKTKLSTLVNSNKISAIPLPNSGLHRINHKNQNQIKKQLGLNPKTFYVVFAGYVTWYKGADWLVKTFKQTKKHIKGRDIKLILAGGKSSSLEIDTKYMNWFNHLSYLINKNKDVSITGVLDEKVLPKYIAAADLIVMPYRLMMSASGPFTLAQTAGTPVVVSNHLKPMTKSEDLALALSNNGLTSNDFTFNMNLKSLSQKLNRAVNDKKYLTALTKTVSDLSPLRSCQNQAQAYLNLFTPSFAKLDLWPNTSPNLDTSPHFAK